MCEHECVCMCMCMCVCVCEETHMTAPATVRLAPSSFCWVTPENVVGMATGRKIMERQRLQEREWEKDRKSERPKRRKRGRGHGASWCESASDHLVLLLHPLALSLSICSTLSFLRSHLNSSPSASLHCDVRFRSSITTEMRQSGPTHTHWTHIHTS